MGREICHLSLWKGPEGLTDDFYGFIKSRKRFIFVIDSYLKFRINICWVPLPGGGPHYVLVQ